MYNVLCAASSEIKGFLMLLPLIVFFVSCVIAIGSAINTAIKKYKRKKNGEVESDDQANNSDFEDADSYMTFVGEVIGGLGCSITHDGNDTLVFMFQGEQFVVSMADRCHVWINNYCWSHVEADDPDLPYVKEAVNLLNATDCIINHYSNNKKDGTMDLHCSMRIYLSKNIPYVDDYLRFELGIFFNTHQRLRDKFYELKAAHSKKRTIIKGFNSHE